MATHLILVEEKLTAWLQAAKAGKEALPTIEPIIGDGGVYDLQHCMFEHECLLLGYGEGRATYGCSIELSEDVSLITEQEILFFADGEPGRIQRGRQIK